MKFVKMTLSIAMVMLLIASMILLAFPTSQGVSIPEKEWVDGTYMRDWQTKTLNKHSPSLGGGGGYYPPQDMEISVSDFGLNIDYDQNFRWVMTGTHCYIYVAYDLLPPYYNYYDPATDEYVFVNPNYPPHVPPGGWTPMDRISTAYLTYFMNEFDNTIYPTCTGIFGMPINRPANDSRIYILIMNIRDGSYYDSSYTWYVAGYFSWGEAAAEDKNMIHIDSYDWQRRVGPGVARPYLYESVFAHELEHLIHNDIDPGEESWVDEGLADLSGYFCGYGHESGHIYYYLTYHLLTSLTFWGGALENYGACYLFQLYLWEHFGGTPFTMDLVSNPLHGIDGIMDTLSDRGYTISFDEIFRRWAIANYIDDTSIGNGEYGYFTLDIPSRDTWGISIEYRVHNNWIGGPYGRGFYMASEEWYGPQQPYTAQYFDLAFNPSLGPAYFDYGGDEYSGVIPYSGDYHWWAGMGNWAWRKLSQGFSIPDTGATLYFRTYYEIETDWDYAYVEVHDLDTDTWTTLPGLYTTTTLPQPQDNPNTPAGREPMDYYAAGEWNALTGFSPGYYEEQMDLTPFADHNIDLYFVYWTDGAYNEQGFYLDDISIPEIGFFDNVESGADGWTHEPGWIMCNPTYFPNTWTGAVFSVSGVDGYRKPSFRYKMRDGPGMVNFTPGKLHRVWPLQSGSLTIPTEYVNAGHMYVGVFWNGAPHILRGNYWFYAY